MANPILAVPLALPLAAIATTDRMQACMSAEQDARD
jgi:hypothetical protein